MQGFSINYARIDAEFVMRSQNRLMPVFVWTLNKPELIQQAIANNVDGVLSDDVSSMIIWSRIVDLRFIANLCP